MYGGSAYGAAAYGGVAYGSSPTFARVGEFELVLGLETVTVLTITGDDEAVAGAESGGTLTETSAPILHPTVTGGTRATVTVRGW